MKKRTASAIVPAYNEERTIGRVVETLRDSQSIAEVIVVDDGSCDATAARARQAGARVITQKNSGKASAMLVGARAALSQALLFADADLVGFEKGHVDSLLEPLLAGRADMTIGLRDRGAFWNALMATVLPKIGGERAVMRKDFLEMALSARGFGIEIAMNRYCRKHAHTVALVPLRGVMHTLKEKKYGLLRGLLARLRMIADIVCAEVRYRL